jgi:exopolysaccharide biosynthesis protein
MKHTKAIQTRNRLTIKRGVASRRRSVPRPGIGRPAVIAGALAIVVLAILLLARGAIESWTFQRALGDAFDGAATIGFVRHDGDRITLDGVGITADGGAVTLAADSVACEPRGDVWDVRPSGLRASVALDRLPGGAGTLVRSLRTVFAAGRFDVHLDDASVTFERAGYSGPPVAIRAIAGTFLTGDAPSIDLRANLGVGSASYPFAVNGQRLTAAAVPLAPLAALWANPAFAVVSGDARDVDLTSAGGLHAALTLAHVDATIAGHAVTALSGPLAIVPDGIGTTGLDAYLNGRVPLAVAGEVHDGGDWYRIASEGTRDLRALAWMFDSIAAQPDLRWMNVETTAPGMTFGQYAMTTGWEPHVIQLVTVDPNEPTIHIGTALADDHIISHGARTSDLALRTGAVAGLNGDYFDIGRTYEPQGLLIRDGVLLHGPTDHEAVVFDAHNVPTFARFRLTGSVTDGTRTYPVTLYNSWPTRAVAIVTPDYGKLLPAAPGVTFVALDAIGGTRYRVRALYPMTAPLPVTFGIGISDALHEPLPQPGDEVDVRYALDPAVPGAVAGIGSGPLLLHDGRWYEDDHAPAPDERNVQWPVDAIGTLFDGTLVLVSVDGRHPERALGMTRPEFGELLRRFHLREAMALDSGGSVTLVSRAPGNHATTVRNVVSDFSNERYVSDALFVYSSAPLGTIVTAPRPHVEPTPPVEPVP